MGQSLPLFWIRRAHSNMNENAAREGNKMIVPKPLLCGWRCLAASTKWWAGEDLDAESSKAKGALIKTQTISHIRKHFDRYASFIKPDADDSPDAKTIPPSQRVEEFV